MPYSKSNGKSGSSDKVNDIAKELAQTFIDCLKEDQLPWDSGRVELDMLNPYNPKTKSQYAGSSRIILILKSIANGWTDPRFLTFNNAKDLGGFVRKGEHGTNLIRYQPKTVLVKDDDGNVVIDEETGKPKQQEIFMPLPYTVFNVSQIEGLKLEPLVKQEEFNSIDRVDNLIKQTGANIVYDPLCVTPCYRPVSDDIRLPPKDTFLNQDAFYSTMLHELSHWTGHESRLNRGLKEHYNEPDFRAQEELTAEIGSSLLCKALGVPHDLTNSKAYIQSWIKELTDKPKEILKATNRADKIAQYVLKFEQVQDLTEAQEQNLNLTQSQVKDICESYRQQMIKDGYHTKDDYRALSQLKSDLIEDLKLAKQGKLVLTEEIVKEQLDSLMKNFQEHHTVQNDASDALDDFEYHPESKAELKELVDNPEINLGEIDTTKITDMSHLFAYAHRADFNGIENWDVSNVTDMSRMFNGCANFNQDISAWNTGKVENMSGMFYKCSQFNQPLNAWDVSSVENMESMFEGCYNFNQSLNDWCVREDCVCLNTFYRSNLSYANVKDAFTEIQLDNSNSDKIFDEQAEIKKAQMAKEKTSSVNVDLDAVKSKLRKATRF